VIASIFLGPSLQLNEARRLVPSAVFHPPAAQGDLITAVERDQSDVIGLIDGTFHQNLSVWHNEVCYLLSLGVTVYGASSMGALRAVETEPFGMIGVGCVYHWYRDGIITGDDEVALLHGESDSDFRPLSEPLVNIRASMARAVSQGFLDSRFADQLVEVAKALYYPERIVTNILRSCRDLDVSPEQLRAAERALTVDYVDLKQADARELLVTVRDVIDGLVERPKPVIFEFTRSSVFENLYNLDRKIHVGDHAISLQSIAEYTALHCLEFKDIRRASLDRTIVLLLGMMMDISVTSDEVVAERNAFCEEHGLDSSEAISEWLSSNAFSERDLGEYLTQEAICRRLRHWAVAASSLDRGCKALLVALRMRGTFVHWATEASEQEVVVSAYRDQPEYLDIETTHPALLAERHTRGRKVRIRGDAGLWAEEAGFDGVEGLAEGLRRSAIYDDVKRRVSRQLDALKATFPTLSDGAGAEAEATHQQWSESGS
jgi:hypothetical protein